MQRTCEREHRRTLGERDHYARIPHAMTASFTKAPPTPATLRPLDREGVLRAEERVILVRPSS